MFSDILQRFQISFGVEQIRNSRTLSLLALFNQVYSHTTFRSHDLRRLECLND